MLRQIVGGAVAVFAIFGCGDGPALAPRYAILATTTSVQSSGLLDALIPAFRQGKGYDMRVFLAGSGRALEMLRYGDAEVVISHAPEAEARVLAVERRWFYRKIMFNTFVLVGPSDDPAGVKGATTVVEAMRRIAAGTARFVSRGDESGTHERERMLWRLAGASLDPSRLLVSGAGMSTTLRQAGASRAYTLSDRPTFLRLAATTGLALLFEGGAELINTYAVIVRRETSKRGSIAMQWAEWLLNGEGRAIIASYKVAGERAFEPWPLGIGQDDPLATPSHAERQLP